MPTTTLLQVSDEEFIAAVKTSNNIHQALVKLNLSSRNNSYPKFRERCKQIGLSLDHFVKDSVIRKICEDYLIIDSCKNSISRRMALLRLELNPANNSNVLWIDKKIRSLGVDTSHWLGCSHARGKLDWNTIELSSILTKNSSYSRSTYLKVRLLKAGLLEYCCSNCGLENWLNKPISLQLDHINGDNTDNRIENLRLLCPNCHSQTDTFCRSKASLTVDKEVVYSCIDCGKRVSQEFSRCRSCAAKHRRDINTKIDWPDVESLIQMVKETSYCAVSRKLGVSDNAVRKRIKKYKDR